MVDASFGGRSRRFVAVVLALIGLVLLVLVALARADGSPNIGATVSSSSTLYGDPVEVTVSASNPLGQPYGYNLSYRVVLPAGVSYGGGGPVAPKQIADAPGLGETTLIFANASDLSPGATKSFSFDLQYDSGVYDAGDSFAVEVQAFVNDDPRFVPKFDAEGIPQGPEASSFTGFTPEITGIQTLKAIEVEIDEPSPEGEILRGVHDHQTVYTLEVTNNGINPTTETKLDAYVPAGLEFLGCGGAGADNTTDAPTNPGSAEEYPGSGPIGVEPLAGCVEPESVETELVDPDGPGPMPEAIYTHVVWPVGELADGETRLFPYRAAVPVRANTNSFSGARPSAASGNQATNLDNNDGPEVTDETLLRTYAKASGTYQGKAPTPTSDEQILDRTAEDWVVHKSGSSGTLAQGQITTWTLLFETSEYKFVDGATVTDTLPDGLCPLGPENFTSGNDAPDSECDPTGAEPSAPYASATENADGTWTLSWDAGSLAKLGHTGLSDKFSIAFPTKTRTHYQENFEPAGPILAHDGIANTVTTEGSGFARCTAPGAPDCSTPGPKIDFDGSDGATIVDASHAEQEAGEPVILKQVAAAGPDCQAAIYTNEVPHYSPGDRVCWRLRVDFPGTLDTSPQALSDFLPAGTEYVPASDEAGPQNNVSATIDESGAGDGLLTWTVTGSTVPAGGEVFERFITTVAKPSGIVQAGDLTGNLFKFSSENTAEETFPQRAEAEYVLDVPAVDLVKGVEEIVRGGSTVDGPNGPDVDDKTVEADDEVTYRVDVTNSGAQDATGVEVWDVLPAEYPCAAIAAISDGGECVEGSPVTRVVWALPGLAAGGSKKLTYTATVPSDIGPGRTLVNNAGVTQFGGEANTGELFNYTPADNIDPENEATPNAPAADDPSNVKTTGAAIAKAQTTEVTETGNNAATQATIGEKVKYTLTATVPEGTTLGGSAEITDTVSSTERLSYVSGTASATLNGVAVPGTFTLDVSGPTPKLIFPADYANAPGSGDDLVVLSFEMLVTDVAANTRLAGNVTNQAALKWTDPVTGAKSTPSNQTSAQIVEPLITQTKTDDVNPNRVKPGDIVTYTLRATNSNATRVSTAHDVKIVDTVPVGLIPIGPAPGNAPIADGNIIPGTGGAVWDADTRTITRTTATLPPNTPTTLIYRVEVEKPAVAGASLTNAVESTTASLGEAFSGRRTSGTGYKASAEDTIRLAGAAITKGVTPDKATPGNPLTYDLTVTIPASLDLFDTTVFDVLPSGVAFDEYVSETCVSGPCGLFPSPGRYTAATQLPAGTTTIGWDLGDIGALPEPMVVEFTYKAHLRETALGGGAVVRGDTEVNTATVGSNLTDKEPGPFDPSEIPEEFDEEEVATSTVTVIEPDVAIAKEIKVGGGGFTAGPTPAHSNDPLAYRLSAENSGDSPAYDVEVTDTPDAALTNVQFVAQAGVTLLDPWTAGDPDMTWRIDGPIAGGGGKVTLEYTADFVAASALHDGQQVPNTAAIPHYFGVPKATRDANPTYTYRDYLDGGEDSTEAVLDFPTLELEKTTGLGGDPETGSAEINQPFPWRIVVANSSATAGAVNVEVRDTLPPNWQYVAGSAEFDGAAAPDPIVTPSAGGDALEWALPTLAAEADVEITFAAKPLLAAAQNPGIDPEAHENLAAVVSAQDEAGNSGNEEGSYGTDPDEATATLAVPQLNVEKTPDGGATTAGTASSFTIEVDNDGDGVARNVKVEDVLPAGLGYEAGTATANPATGFSETAVDPGPGAGQTTIEWTIASIPASSSVQIELPVKVAAEVADGTTLTNTAAVTSDEETTPLEDEGSLNVETEADMAIEKTGEPGYTAGESYTWHLRVRNLGPSNAENVVVADPLPAGTTFVSATAPCALASGEVKCELGDQPPSFDQTYDVTVEVDPGTTTSPLSNTAKVETDTEDTNPTNDESTFGPTAGSLADVWIEKSAAPEAIDRKQQTTFTLVVGNDGPSTARDVELTDPLPAGLEFVSTDEPPCSQAAGAVTCVFGDMAPGAEETVEITVKGIANGEHDNVATVTTTTPEPAVHKPNSDEATVIVGPVADLALEKTGPATVAADGQLTWTLKATNNGEDPATGVRIVDPLPAGTVFVSADSGCALEGGSVVCAIGDLAVAEAAERQVTVTVPRALADSTVVNSATVDGDQGDDEPGNDSDEASTEVGPSADVSIVKTGPARVNANGTLVWTLAVGNAGPSTATGVSVNDTLPAGVELISATPTQGSCAGAVECQLGALPQGAAAQIQVVVHVPPALQGSSLSNSAAVTAEEPDPVPENNESEATTVVEAPATSDYDLAISKTVDGSARPSLGDTVSYEIVVSNRGPATATGVQVVDALPAALEFVKATVPGGRCAQKNGVVTCKVASLAAGAELRARVTARVMKQGTTKNTATVSAAVADADPSNDKSAAKVRATLGKTKLKLRKTRVGKGAVGAGDRVKYKIRVSNRGDGPAADVVVCDRLPTKLSFAKLSGARLQHGDACWRIDLLPAGATKTFRLTARVDGGVDGGLVRNVAYVKSANAPRSRGVAGVRVQDSGPGRAGGVTG